MSASNHTGDVPQWLDEIYMEKTLKQSLYSNNENFVVKKCNITPGSSIGDNYLCQIFRIQLTIQRGDAPEEVISIIGKFNPETKLYLKFCKRFYDLHDAEGEFYEKTLFDLKTIIKEKLGKTNFGPKFYTLDLDKKIIFMEDLKMKGFLLKPRHEFLDFQHCLKTVEAHATFHAASYLLLQKQPELKKQYGRYIWRKELSSMDWKFIDNTMTALQDNMHNWDLTERQKNMIDTVKQKITRDGLDICEFNENNFNVLLHGDCWKNNMMFQYDDKGQVQDVCLVDFQLVNYNSFAIDLQYSLSSSATREARFERIDELLEFYYKSFCKVAPHVPEFSFERVKEEFASKAYLGLCMALFMRSMVVAANGMDIDGIMDGKMDSSPYESEVFASEIKTILEYFRDVI